MSGHAMQVFVAIHAVDHASGMLMRFSNLAAQAGNGIAGINKQLAVMGSLAAVIAGTAGVGAMLHLGKEAVNASMKVSQLRMEMENLGLTAAQISKASGAVAAITQLHPSISSASGMHLFKDTYSVLGNYDEAIKAMPFMAKFQLAMRGTYGERGDEMSYDAVRAAELQMGKHFNMKGLQTYLDVYTKVVNATGGRVDPQQIHGFMKNSVYGRMSQSPDSLAKQIMLMLEMGGPRAGTAFNAIDRFAIAHIAQNGVSKEKMEKWASYGLIENIKRNEKGKITDFNLVNQGLYQKDKVEWLYSVFAPTLKKHGIDAMDPSGIPKIAQMFSTQTGAGGAITTLLQVMRNQKESGMYQRASGVDESSKRYEASAWGSYGGLVGAWSTFLHVLGDQLAPMLVGAAQGITQVLQAMTAWMRIHPGMTKGLFLLTTGFFGLLTIIGGVVAAIVLLPGQILAFTSLAVLGITTTFAYIVSIVITQGNNIKNAFRSFMLGIVWMINGMAQGIAGAMNNIPGIQGASQGFSNAAAGWAAGAEKSLGGSPKAPAIPGKSGHNVSQTYHINVKGGNGTPKEIAFAVRDVLRNVVAPKAGYGFDASPNGMHGFT